MSQVLPPLHFQPAPRSPSNGVAVSKGSDATALAWQREMEQAQMSQWFRAAKTSVAATTAPPRTAEPARPPEPSVRGSGMQVQKESESSPSRLLVDHSSVKPHADRLASDSSSRVLGLSQVTEPQRPIAESVKDPAAIVTTGFTRGDQLPPSATSATQVPNSQMRAELPPEKFLAQPATLQMDAVVQINPKTMLAGTAVLRLQAAAADLPVSTLTAPDSAPSELPQGVCRENPQHTPVPGLVSAQRWVESAGLVGVRCHAQWSAQGVNVWLGMDASVQEPTRQLAWIISQLQQSLSQQGHVLGAVVCNGRTVFQGDRVGLERAVSHQVRRTTTDDLPRFEQGSYNTLFQQE